MTLLVSFLMFVGHFIILKENLVQCVVLHGFLFCKSYLHAQIHTVHTISKPMFGSPVLVKRVCNHGRCMAAGMQHWVKQGHATFYTRIQIEILCCTFSLSHWMIPQQQGGQHLNNHHLPHLSEVSTYLCVHLSWLH